MPCPRLANIYLIVALYMRSVAKYESQILKVFVCFFFGISTWRYAFMTLFNPTHPSKFFYKFPCANYFNNKIPQLSHIP